MTAAPVPLGPLSGAVLDSTLYVWIPGSDRITGMRPAFLNYQPADDRWEELDVPPVPADAYLQLVATDAGLAAYHPSQERGVTPDLLYDPGSETWSELPQDPLAASFDRAMVWSGTELILLGLEVVPNPGSAAPSLYRAAALDLTSGDWRRLPDSEVGGWNSAWFWAGHRVVNPSLGSADGGQVNNWGRSYAFGGALDPGGGAWSPLPAPPPAPGPYQGLSIGGPDDVVSTEGWVLQVPTQTWIPLPRPPSPAFMGEAAAWAGDRLIVWGGVQWVGNQPKLLDTGWAWRP